MSSPAFPVANLLAWFRAYARDLPWRRTTDPYAIWVSEIMLQQTQVKTVIPYWERWMRELPTIQSLAEAPEQKLLKLWEGLGYYTRVRNLQKGALQIIERHDGKFPTTHEDILALSGIGRYTAGAIGSIAFNQPVPLLDGNVIRVLTRFYGISENAKEKETTNRLWAIAEELVTEAFKLPAAPISLSSNREAELRQERAGERRPNKSDAKRTSKEHSASNLLLPSEGRRIEDEGCQSSGKPSSGTNCSHLNQSLMELGATICTPIAPACLLCPLQKACIANRDSRQSELPNLGERAAATQRRFFAYVIQQGPKVLVRQRPTGVVNAGLWEFPNIEVELKTKDPLNAAQQAWSQAFTTTEPLCTIKHSITRYRITLEAFRAEIKPRAELPAELGEWYPLDKLHDLPFTSAHGKIRKKLLG
ncbi:MAG TPA: A/G-specific adenine glycosylase [Verrucomicrobiae bacterium]